MVLTIAAFQIIEYSFNYASSRAATPGNTLPSMNSSEAPPPVET